MAFYDWEWSCTYCGQRFPSFRTAAGHERVVHPQRTRVDATRRLQAWYRHQRRDPVRAAARIQQWYRAYRDLSDGFVLVEVRAGGEKNPCQ